MVRKTPEWEIPLEIGVYNFPLTIRNELSSHAYGSKLVQGVELVDKSK